MNIFFLIFAATGLFFVLQKVFVPILDHLLNGPFNEYYLKYLNNNTRFLFDTASKEMKANDAWEELVFQKVEELKSRKVSYAKRGTHLKYIKASGKVSKKLIDELILALPNQHNPEFQAKLTAFISELQNKLEKNNGHNHKADSASISKTVISTWAFAVSAWISGAVYFLFSMWFWEEYSFLLVMLLNLGLFITMLFPLLRLVWSGLAKATGVMTLVTILIYGIDYYAQQAHTGKGFVGIDLSSYTENTTMTIRYPLWLNSNHIEECKSENALVVDFRGKISETVYLSFEGDRLALKNSNCTEIVPAITDSLQPNQKNQILSFFLAPRDNSALNSEKVIITPEIIKADDTVSQLTPPISIEMEDWRWRNFANPQAQLGSAIITIIAFLVKTFVGLKQ